VWVVTPNVEGTLVLGTESDGPLRVNMEVGGAVLVGLGSDDVFVNAKKLEMFDNVINVQVAFSVSGENRFRIKLKGHVNITMPVFRSPSPLYIRVATEIFRLFFSHEISQDSSTETPRSAIT
jgi:hypothetical protein